MEFIIHGKKVEVTEAIKKHIESKIGKLSKYLGNPSAITATVVIRVRGTDQIVEVTIPIKKITLRAEESHVDLYAAIDLVSEKLERQIRKNKTRISNQDSLKNFPIDLLFEFEQGIDEPTDNIVKRKSIEMKPMSEEEAILQMNLIGHDFFVFVEQDSGITCVLYKRKDGNYGIIETN